MTPKILEGDCFDLLKNFKDKSFNHIITDPPYSDWVHRNMMGNRKGPPVSRDCGFDFLTDDQRVELCHHACRIATGWLCFFSDWESVGLWRDVINAAGGRYCRAVPWIRWSSPNFSGQSPPSSSEAVVFGKPKTKGRKWINGGRVCYAAKGIRNNDVDNSGHSTPKPEELMMDILADCTEPGDSVLDPMCGRGTTGVAAIRMGRTFTGIEQDEDHAGYAKKRLAAEINHQSVRHADAGQMSLLESIK